MLHSIEYLSEFDIIESINILKPDVVHLHWVQHNFFKIEDIGKISVPIVWTLHDMWPFCGAEHYTFDKRYIEGYKSENQPSYESGFDLNKWVWMRKKKHWEKIISKLYAIGVSTWVTGEASKSNLFQKTRTATIWNSLDTRVFFPMDKDLCRKKMGFPLGVKLILAGAINFSGDSRKGTNYLLEAIKLLSEQKNHEDYCLILFGSDIFVRGLGIPIINLGKIDNDNELTTIYSAADVMVVPSLQETFGQTAIEAMACATPVVCFDTTGLRDIVDHKENGYRAKCFDPDDLLEGIKWVTGEEENQKKLSENALAKVNRNFTYKTMGSNYLEIYKRLTS
jgi:glycosyltransferase involved in cell wall biosynthesis